MASCSLTWICFPESIEASFWIFSNLFSNRVLLLWIISNLSTCDFFSSFNSLICSSSSWLRFLRHWFFSCFSRIFPAKSSLECSAFWLVFNFLILVTNVLLWFLTRNTYSVLLVNVLLLSVTSNLCAFLPQMWVTHMIVTWANRYKTHLAMALWLKQKDKHVGLNS